jgi:hypothetical protein
MQAELTEERNGRRYIYESMAAGAAGLATASALSSRRPKRDRERSRLWLVEYTSHLA